MTGMTAEPLTLTDNEFDRLFEKLKNWGRWGDNDELGTLNFLGEKEVAEAARLGEDRPPCEPGAGLGHRGRSGQWPPGAALHDEPGRHRGGRIVI